MTSSSSEQLPFTVVESDKIRDLAASVLLIDLYKTRDEEVFFLGRWSLPVIRLSDGHYKTDIRSPLLLLLFEWCRRHQGAI